MPDPSREPRSLAGARAPLFDRLTDEDAPPRVLDRAGLLASVTVEIQRLFNTRRPGPRRWRNTIDDDWCLDYGVPDFGGRSAASASDREAYAAELARALLAFEPRIVQARIVLEPVPGAPLRLAGSLSAQVRIGTVREPVTFPLLLNASTGAFNLDGSTPADAPAVAPS